MTSIPESLVEQIPTWDLRTLYEHFDILDPNEEIKLKIDNGINMTFPIESVLDGDFDEFPNNQTVRILGFGEGDLLEFKREIRKRKKEMLKYIYDNYNNDVTKGRVDEEW